MSHRSTAPDSETTARSSVFAARKLDLFISFPCIKECHSDRGLNSIISSLRAMRVQDLQTLFLLANPLQAIALRVELFLRAELAQPGYERYVASEPPGSCHHPYSTFWQIFGKTVF